MDQFIAYLSFLPDWAVGPFVACAIIIGGYLIAKIAAAIVSSTINRTGIGQKAQITGGNIGRSLSKAVFWVLWLVFILMGLGQFPVVDEALTPIKGMMDNIFDYLPQLIVGIAILAVGAMLARVVKEALTSTLEAAQVDHLANRFGFSGADASTGGSIARAFGGLASSIVIIFFTITAIGIWDIPGITAPVSDMLATVLDYIPHILGATIILAITVFIARFVSNLAQNTLPALGIDTSLTALSTLDGESRSNVKPSKIISSIAFIGIMLMGLTAVMNVLNIELLSSMFYEILGIGGNIVLGATIIGAGIFIANMVARFLSQTTSESIVNVVRYILILLTTFMGLSRMQLGDGIVETAFSYGLGAAAVAGGLGGAIAFGMGGREWAAKKLQEWWPTQSSQTRRK